MAGSQAPGWTRGLDGPVDVHIQGLRGPFQQGALIDRILELREAHDAVVQVFDPAAVYGRAHLVAAVEKAVRAHRQDRAIARDLATEIACYAAGTDQISRALELVGIPDEGDAFVAVGLDAGGKAALADLVGAGFEPDDGLPGRPVEALDRLGIAQTAREAVTEERWELLVVEHVALVDAGR